MSHRWIYSSLESDNTIPASHKDYLTDSIQSARVSRKNPTTYNREIYMVTGKQYEQHDRSKGKLHNIQMPLIFFT